jgi:hypothetical protein
MPFKIEKIKEAILKAMVSVKNGEPNDAADISKQVYTNLLERKHSIPNYIPNVEVIQDLVEHTLMRSEFLDVAKAYILYRNIQTKKRQRNIFEKRVTLKPFEYPELYEYVPAIRHSYSSGYSNGFKVTLFSNIFLCLFLVCIFLYRIYAFATSKNSLLMSVCSTKSCITSTFGM